MNSIDPQHTLWFTLISALAYKCLPWFAAQGEKLVDAWVRRIEGGNTKQ